MSTTGIGVYCNTKIDGGGEQSAKQIAKMLGCPLYSLTTDEWKNHQPEMQVWYMNDAVYRLFVPENIDYFKFNVMNAKKVFIILNFVVGGMNKQKWAKDYVKKFLFLNKEKRDGFLEGCVDELKDIPRVALPPAVDIEQFLNIERDYNREVLTIGRHSRISLKYPNDPVPMYKECKENITDVKFAFQIPHPKIKKEFEKDERFILNTWNQVPVRDFLASIDVYLSIINPKTRDQGPRTLIEAMASGLPCVVENRDGMKERIIHGETGYLVNSEKEAIEAVVKLCHEKEARIRIGKTAREIARSFRPERWLDEMK